MKFVMFAVKTLIVMLVLWGLGGYVYGTEVLAENIVPVEGMEISAWIGSYNNTCFLSGVVGVIFSVCWFCLGLNYKGFSQDGFLRFMYYGILVVSILCGLGIFKFFIPDYVEGIGYADIIVTVMPALVYFITSMIATESTVKHIPPIAF